jgi:glycosyltransferase involved in cell wall biosynthesis
LGRQLGDCQDDAVILVQVTPLQVPSYLTIWLATGRRSRRVLLCHNVLPHESRPFDRVLMRLLLRRADAVLVHSESQADLARTLLGRGRTGATPRVEIAALPPHLPAVPTRAVQTAATASRRLLFFGVVRPYKGLDVLLQALATLPEDVTLTVAGEFWDDPRGYERQAERLGLGARVQFRPGYVPAPQIAPLLAEADALVMPYRSATASQNVQLAFAHGLPVVVTRTGALAEQVRPGVNGLLADPNDVASLSRALHRLYEPGVLDHLRANLPTSGGRDEDAWTRYVAAIETLVADTQPIVGLPR